MRYLLDNLNEEQILAIDREGDIANCSITEYKLHRKTLSLVRYNFVPPPLQESTAVTAEPRKNKTAP